MINVVTLWQNLMQSAKTGTNGYQTADEFNRDLESVQISLMSLLCPLYAKDTMVQELLSPFIKEVSVSTTKPAECYYFLGATIGGVPAYEISPVQASLYQSSPIRNPGAIGQTAYFYQVNSAISYIHSGTLSGEMQYIRKPLAATIVLTPVSTADRDYVNPTAGVNLEWPDSAFNLILYMMMQKLGLEMKDQLIMEFSNMGIQIETSKI